MTPLVGQPSAVPRPAIDIATLMEDSVQRHETVRLANEQSQREADERASELSRASHLVQVPRDSPSSDTQETQSEGDCSLSRRKVGPPSDGDQRVVSIHPLSIVHTHNPRYVIYYDYL